MTTEQQDLATSFARFYRERLAPRLDTQVRPRLEQAIEHLSHSAFDRQRRALEDRLRDVDRPFMLFIVGAGNAGKSSLVNAIAGRKVAPVSIKPLTWKIDVYQHSAEGHDHATVRWADGTTRACSVDEAQRLCEAEEAKAKAVEAKGQAHTGEIIEVIWSLTGTTLPPEVQLVDTPGIHQNRANLRATDLDQGGYRPLVGGGDALIGLAEVYFHRADGVLWVFDGTCLDAATGHAVEELGFYDREQYAVINKIDALDGVTPDQVVARALKLLGEHFQRFLLVSARQALTSPEAGGIKALMDFVGDVFLRDACVKKARSTWSLVQAELAAAERIARAEALRLSELNQQIIEVLTLIRKDAVLALDSRHDTLRTKIRDIYNRAISRLDRGFLRLIEGRAHDVQKMMLQSRLPNSEIAPAVDAYLDGIKKALIASSSLRLAKLSLVSTTYSHAGIATKAAHTSPALKLQFGTIDTKFDIDAFHAFHVTTDDDLRIRVDDFFDRPVDTIIRFFGRLLSGPEKARPRHEQEDRALEHIKDTASRQCEKVIDHITSNLRQQAPRIADECAGSTSSAIDAALVLPIHALSSRSHEWHETAARIAAIRQHSWIESAISTELYVS